MNFQIKYSIKMHENLAVQKSLLYAIFAKSSERSLHSKPFFRSGIMLAHDAVTSYLLEPIFDNL
ncbi:hypothetical protein JF50_17965 [Pseudoalteromonas luteoviolacea]|uniref:Uncharacterized protein n=1 Tax=Pseudoalteromonas luteoviolacea TaxID=43657 RepID=A0A0C1Q6C7_9GAMM|nr:hypothetical protein JF50_17965 [Pseudoalteromonas luteoviolacea]